MGPTDDRRIKPDLVANGVSLWSYGEENDFDYISLSGTSMSAPGVSGSINLLAQHYTATHDGTTLTAAAMKALVLRTADEAGSSSGPDYSFGWGLMNTRAAAELISDDVLVPSRLLENRLYYNETDTYVMTWNGEGPIRVTLAWTDPPGTPPDPAIDPPDPMLVHDLDLRLVHTDTGMELHPYLLDPAQPDLPASTATTIGTMSSRSTWNRRVMASISSSLSTRESWISYKTTDS
jgi:hypothetical protein